MKSASKLFLCFACLALVAGVATAQQTFINEDFASGAGNTPPSGWSTITNVAFTGLEEWRFDNPGTRTIPPNMTVPVATWDDDFLSASGAIGVDGELISPAFNASGVPANLLLQWEHEYPNTWQSITILVEVFDGANWNTVYSQTTGAPASTQVLDITTAAGGSSHAQVRFHWTMGSWGFWWHVDDVMVFEPAMGLDVGVTAIVQPNAGSGALNCGGYTNNETVEIQVQNFAFTSIPAGTMIPVVHDVNGANLVAETMTTTNLLAFGQSENYTFTAGADLTVTAPHNLTCATAAGDLNAANDAMSLVVPPAGGGMAPLTLPVSEDFGTLLDFTGTAAPAGWVNDTGDNANDDTSDGWHYDMDGTSSGVGPPADATTGTGTTSYAFIEDSVSATDETRIDLVSPCIDLSGTSTPTLSFQAWSFDQNPTAPAPNECKINILTFPGGGVVNLPGATVPDLGAGVWTPRGADLSPFIGQIIRVVFSGRNDNGALGTPTATFYHDLSIDDVVVFDALPSFGQPSTVGFGTLDVNGAGLNGQMLPVGSGSNGPYSMAVSLSAGDSLAMTIGGEAIPGLASILFIGRTLAGGVPIPGFGTVDLSPIDPMLPIAIVGNGFSPASFIDGLFFTDVNGEINLTFPVTTLTMALSPFGLSAINLTPGHGGITITNTLDVTVNP